MAFEQLALDPTRVLAAFEHYMTQDGTAISRANAEERMLGKLTRSLTEDIAPLLAPDVAYGDTEALHAFERVWSTLVAGLKGESWKVRCPDRVPRRLDSRSAALDERVSRRLRMSPGRHRAEHLRAPCTPRVRQGPGDHH